MAVPTRAPKTCSAACSPPGRWFYDVIGGRPAANRAACLAFAPSQRAFRALAGDRSGSMSWFFPGADPPYALFDFFPPEKD